MQGCFSCWIKCVIKDDMGAVLSLINSSDILVLATPRYFDNISGMLKTFMDRSIVIGDPHFQKDANGECRHLKSSDVIPPKLMIMSNCGFPERSHFQVISHWIKRAALNMHTEIVGEIYTTQGGLLTAEIEELQPVISNYLNNLQKAGREIVSDLKISEDTKKNIRRKFYSR